ncbi:MAG: discoidin domain-containing protein [Candidatus Howiella sp.]|jgi:hypothetical protein
MKISAKFKKFITILLSLTLITAAGGAQMATHADTTDSLYESFKNPSLDTKPAPLWFWNSEVEDMTTDQVREIVRESYLQSGYGGFGILPEWQSSYLTDEYFALYEAALDEGSKYGMRFSLYDENGFPSYNAGGLLEENYPELTTKRLDMYQKNASNGQTVKIKLPDGKLMGAVAMNTDTLERIDISEFAVVNEANTGFDPASVPIGVSASSTYSISPGYEAAKAVDGKMSTRWNSESGSGGKQYLIIKYDEAKTFDRVDVFEDSDPELHRTSEYFIQYYDYTESKWVNLAKGKKITDTGVSHSFDAINTDMVRLYIKSVTSDSASISEFHVFCGDEKLAVPTTEDPSQSAGVSGSSRYNEDFDAKFAFDGSFATRWNSADATNPPHWLEMKFSGLKTVDNVKVYQSMDRITKFEIQYWENDQWKTCYDGTSIGQDTEGSHIIFDPVTTTKMRLYITQTSDFNPSIWELEFYDGDTLLSYDDDSEQNGSHLEYTVPEGNWKVMAFVCVVDGRDGMDYLSKDSVAAFIDITYEAYYSRFKKYFDNGTIVSAFFDEPSFWPAGGRTPYGADGARFWTPTFNEDYENHFGSSPVLDYPALFMDIGESTAEARDKFQYIRTELFANNYIGQLNEWCADHGIELTGHMLFEEWVNPVGVHGDLMKVFKNQAIPGVDLINNFGYTQEAYKIVSSSANNWDKSRVMSEAFGVFQGKNMDDIYRSSMDLFAKGINLIIPHAVWYDDDPSKVTYVPELSYRDANFGPHLSAFSDYIGRSQTILQQGTHVADIGMVYPIDYLESEFYFNDSPNNPEDADYMNIGEILSLNARKDFTYLHPDVIDDRCSVDGAKFQLNNQVNSESYKVMIIPGCKVISLTNLEKIKKFYDNGGKVIGTTQLPYLGTRAEDNAKVAEIIEEMFGIDPTKEITSDGINYISSSNYSSNYNAEMAFDGIYGSGSRWNAGQHGADQWLGVEFPEKTWVDHVVITESFGRVSGFEIQYWDDSTAVWKTVHTGTEIGTSKEIEFGAINTTKIRVYFTGVSNNSASIEEFEIYMGGSKNLALDTSQITNINENQAGGKAYFIGKNAKKNLPTALDDALSVYDLEIDNVGNINGGNLSYIHKIVDGRDVYFFGNSSDDVVDATVQIRGELNNPMFWDPLTGDKSKADYTVSQVDGETVTTVQLKLGAIKSLFLVPELADDDFLLGDIDDDGKVTVSDVVKLRQLIMSSKCSDKQLKAGDFDTNKSLTVSDVVALRSHIVKGSHM